MQEDNFEGVYSQFWLFRVTFSRRKVRDSLSCEQYFSFVSEIEKSWSKNKLPYT